MALESADRLAAAVANAASPEPVMLARILDIAGYWPLSDELRSFLLDLHFDVGTAMHYAPWRSLDEFETVAVRKLGELRVRAGSDCTRDQRDRLAVELKEKSVGVGVDHLLLVHGSEGVLVAALVAGERLIRRVVAEAESDN